MKTRELRFCRHGRTHEEYQAFLQTNRNSRHFSVYLAVVLVLAAAVDFIMMVVMMFLAAPSVEALANAGTEGMMQFAQVAMDVGFGGSVMLIVVAPIMLLYSYTRIPKNKMISTLIPAAGIVLIILIVIEGIYQMLGYLPVEKINIRQTVELLQQIPLQ
ncbi:MAG: hypothetical protein IKE25_07490, partial [Clostridia bacterium]|nr:hypothetical protein [Clostridia bacterium]